MSAQQLPARRVHRHHQPDNHQWVWVGWVLPMSIALVLTILTAGFLLPFFVVAIGLGIVATVMAAVNHHQERRS